jgi:hypothetical protein
LEIPTCGVIARECVGFDIGLFRLRFGLCRTVLGIVDSQYHCQEERRINNGDDNDDEALFLTDNVSFMQQAGELETETLSQGEFAAISQSRGGNSHSNQTKKHHAQLTETHTSTYGTVVFLATTKKTIGYSHSRETSIWGMAEKSKEPPPYTSQPLIHD